jgi:thiol-disulfide isomerase/thioredoxin
MWPRLDLSEVNRAQSNQMTACPKCASPLPENALECARCGVVLAKVLHPGERPLETVLASGCPRCKRDVPEGAVECPHCRVMIAKAHHPGDKPLETVAVRRPLHWVALVVVGLGLAFVLIPHLKPRRLGPVEILPAVADQADPCLGRSRCVIVVVAPWCPACKSSVPVIRKLADRWADSTDVGFKAIVTYASEAEARKMADGFGPGVVAFIDPSARFMQEAHVSGVPHWFVVGDQGRILKDSAGGYDDADAQVRELGLAPQHR